MTECTRLSDRMPAVAARTEVWSAAEAAHLSACGDCAGEWALVRAGAALGRELGWTPDVDAITSAVRARITADRLERASIRRRTAWSAALAAAAIALAVWTGRPATRPVAIPARPSSVQSAALVPELDSLDAGELEDVLDAFDAPLSERVMLGTPTLGDLSDQELERVLRAGGV